MKRTLLILSLAVTLPRLTPAAVDLTPRFIDIFTDGATLHRLYFIDGDRKVTVSLNRETEVTPDSGGAMFRFKKLPEATFLVVRSRNSPAEKFEGATLDRYRESARRLIPVQGRDSVIREETFDAYPINNWKSFRIVLAYDVRSVREFQSVTFINLNDSDQIVLITSAPEKDFEEAEHRSHQIFRTWQEMLPGDEAPIRGN
jgi:hypothetical protein